MTRHIRLWETVTVNERELLYILSLDDSPRPRRSKLTALSSPQYPGRTVYVHVEREKHPASFSEGVFFQMMPCIGTALQRCYGDQARNQWLKLPDEDITVLKVFVDWLKKGRRDVARISCGDEVVGTEHDLLCKFCVFGERYGHQDLATQAADRFRIMRRGFFYRMKFWTPDVEQVRFVFSYSTVESGFRRMMAFNTASRLFCLPRYSTLREWMRISRCCEAFDLQVHEAIIDLAAAGADPTVCRDCGDGFCKDHGYVWVREQPKKIVFDNLLLRVFPPSPPPAPSHVETEALPRVASSKYKYLVAFPLNSGHIDIRDR